MFQIDLITVFFKTKLKKIKFSFIIRIAFKKCINWLDLIIKCLDKN